MNVRKAGFFVKTMYQWVGLQFPMTTVLTTRVRRVAWFSAVLFFRRAVV